MRLIDADYLKDRIEQCTPLCVDSGTINGMKIMVDLQPTVQTMPVIHCKDCKHRPTLTDPECDAGFKYEFPDERCPCQCEDPWFNWMPEDDWYCGNAERKEE